jgi:pyruvate/2-oxoglutarate dehydrogenase complex dihydrolipoamide dehydrogenase (E3) component
VIATGSRPNVPDVPGLNESRWLTNETVFGLTELPERLLVIGSGATGCELAQAFARLGSRVTLAARTRVLRAEDADAARAVEAALRADGTDVVPETPDPRGFDAVLVAAGRLPNVEALNLAAAGVRFDPKAGVAVDDYLRTTNRRVFAAGDVTALGLFFTHAADAMARLVVRNALTPTRGRVSALVIPWCTYTDPEVGRVGLNEAEAAGRGTAVDVFRYDLPKLDRGATDAAEGFVKVVTKKGTDRVLGATVVGPHAGELVGTLSVAVTNGIGLKELANTVLPYPTLTEAVKKVADAYTRSRLTPRARWLIGKWLKWFR